MASSALLRVPGTFSAVSRITSPKAPVPRRASKAIPLTQDFIKIVWGYFHEHGRHDLPWRKTHNPYRILVSEIMLQQTQVERVIPFYKEFMRKFPTAKKLAQAPLSEVLRAWQGLGYNRRAKMLQQAAKEIVQQGIPKDVPAFEELSGVGPYTASAVAAFAYNQNGVVIETNIRTAVIHHFFPKKNGVSDAEIAKILLQVLPKGKSREWYSALMDYGAHLKRSGISHNARSATHAKQSKFAGSVREARGAILRALMTTNGSRIHLESLLGSKRKAQMKIALDTLYAEGLVQKKGETFSLPN